MSALRMNVMALVMMFMSFTIQAETYSGAGTLDISVTTAVAISIVIDDGGDGVISFSGLVSGDSVDASANYNITADTGKSLTCLFKRTNGNTFGVGVQASVLIRTGNASSDPSIGTMYFTLNGCEVGDNSMTMTASISTSFNPDTTYYVPGLSIIVSYDTGVISSYT